MGLADTLSLQTIAPELEGETKLQVIEELFEMLMNTGLIQDRDVALESILEREEKMSTGIQDGIAIPHGKSDVVDGITVCFGRKSVGVDFDALDGEPSRLFFMTISPPDATSAHIELLSEISAILSEEDVRGKLLAAKTASDILRILTA